VAKSIDQLSEISRKVTQEKFTERPGTGALLFNKDTGTYNCIVCDQPLFKSDNKIDSDMWPSFSDAIVGATKQQKDYSHGMVRDEVLCANCDAHLGHVFGEIGQDPEAYYCINSAALDFLSADQAGVKAEADAERTDLDPKPFPQPGHNPID
jgi:peptide-methionine (R)-S-oxide reductase